MPEFIFRNSAVCYSDTGAGQALMLIPGLGGQLGFWGGVTETLARHFRVISFDHPGSGGSAPSIMPLTIDYLAKLAFSLLDHLGAGQCHLVGQSMGGAVAQTMALQRPERIDRLVLSSTWAAPDAGFLRSFELRLNILQNLGLDAYAKAQVLACLSPEDIARDPDMANKWERKTRENSNPNALVERIKALMAFENASGASKITQPTLVIGTDDDQVVPVHMSRQLADMIPGAQRRFLRRGGHFAAMTNPTDYLTQVLPFLLKGKTSAPTVSVLMIGCGAIGRHVIKSLRSTPGARVTAVLVRPERVTFYAEKLGSDIVVASDMVQLSGLHFDYAVECGGHAGLRMFGPQILRHGIDLGVLSVGALSDVETATKMEAAAQEGQAGIEMLAGALAGVDALRALRCSGINKVQLTSSKPPRGWRGSIAEDVVDLDTCSAPVELFSGTAREAARLYPKNANVAATVALNGVGLDATQVTLIADPSLSRNTHELSVSGRLGSFTARLEGSPLPENPRSSAMAALSAIAAIQKRRAGQVRDQGNQATMDRDTAVQEEEN